MEEVGLLIRLLQDIDIHGLEESKEIFTLMVKHFLHDNKELREIGLNWLSYSNEMITQIIPFGMSSNTMIIVMTLQRLFQNIGLLRTFSISYVWIKNLRYDKEMKTKLLEAISSWLQCMEGQKH